MAENFDLIFGQNASQQYAWSDNDYQNGWETIGSIPPTAAQFDALQRRSDTKMKELNDELTPLVNAETADNRQPATEYSEGVIKYTPLLPTGWFLECTVAGITDTSEIVLPTTPAEKDTVVDGTVTWTIRKMGSGSGDGVPLGAIIAYSANGTLPSGYLLCDGSAVSRTMYPDLFSAIGTTYGAGDGSTTFNVPDYNTAKRFAQGDTVAGTVKQAGLPNITGTTYFMTNKNHSRVPTDATGAFFGEIDSYISATSGSANGSDFYNGILSLNASLSNPIYGASDTVQPNALTARYIIKAFDGQTADSALIDITQYASELATKANRQLSNLDTANLECHVVVDSYYDSTTGDWWREYDDGWIEQGGHLPNPSGNASSWGTATSVTLLKPMADSNYTMSLGDYEPDASNSAYGYKLTAKTTTGFTFQCFNEEMTSGTLYPFDYLIFGMGAQS